MDSTHINIKSIEERLSNINSNMSILCRHSGVSRTTITYWKQGKVKASLRTLDKLRSALMFLELQYESENESLSLDNT